MCIIFALSVYRAFVNLSIHLILVLIKTSLIFEGCVKSNHKPTDCLS